MGCALHKKARALRPGRPLHLSVPCAFHKYEEEQGKFTHKQPSISKCSGRELGQSPPMSEVEGGGGGERDGG